GPDIGDDVQVVRVGRQRLADDLVRHVRAVVVGRVDVVDAQVDGGAHHPDRRVAVLRRAEDVRSRELHGAVADAGEVEVADPVAGEGGGGGHVPPLQRARRPRRVGGALKPSALLRDAQAAPSRRWPPPPIQPRYRWWHPPSDGTTWPPPPTGGCLQTPP